MKIGLTGASGFIAQRFIALAQSRGHEIVGFSGNPERPVRGCVETREFAPGGAVNINGCEALVHLAGENVFGLWTHQKKRRIFRSRKFGTRALVDAIAASASPPRVLVSGSATGFYGDTGENAVDENGGLGAGFLAKVCDAWEAEALHAREFRVRVVLLRTGIVLGQNGGALRAMTPLFRAGLGGKIGGGAQWMSWIHLDDEVALILFALENSDVAGPLNAVSPEPVRNAHFTRALAQTLHRPALFRAPRLLLEGALGEFSRELLDSRRVLPQAALDHGFQFQFPALSTAFREIFKDPASRS